MHAATLRRLLVLGVCVAGVSCLYLLPGSGRAPQQTTGTRPQERPATQPSATVVTEVSASSRPRPSTTRQPSMADPVSHRDPEPARRTTAATEAPTRPPVRGGTPFDPAGPADEVAPAPVAVVRTAAATPERLTLHWPPASDNVGVVSYRVLLDGYEVATTPTTSATVRWFNDDASNHVVQVQAVDAAGNQSAASPSLLVERPAPPAPSGTPTATPGPSGPAIPEPSSSPSTGAADEDPDDSSTDQGEEPPVTPASRPHPSPDPGAR